MSTILTVIYLISLIGCFAVAWNAYKRWKREDEPVFMFIMVLGITFAIIPIFNSIVLLLAGIISIGQRADLF